METSSPRVLIVSTFVLPHLGGVEMFVEWARSELERQGFVVRTLAGAWPSAKAEVTIPVVPLFDGRWPLPRGGLWAAWREVGRADVVLANAHHYLLPLLVAGLAYIRGCPVVFVLHGADDAMANTPQRLRLVRAWNHFIARPLLGLTTPIALSGVGRVYAATEMGVVARQLHYPLPEALPLACALPVAASDELLRVVWAGRLVPEKDPLAAVTAVEMLRRDYEAELEVFGDGPLMELLQELASDRPWLHLRGTRPWSEVVDATAAGHAFLATSKVDNVYVSALEAMAIGTPTVATAVGEVPAYYPPSLARFCLAGGDSDTLGEALQDLACDWERWSEEFRANGARLRARHASSGELLGELLRVEARRSRKSL